MVIAILANIIQILYQVSQWTKAPPSKVPPLGFTKAHPRYVFHRHGGTIQLYQQQFQVGFLFVGNVQYLLRVRCALHLSKFRRGVNGAQEDGLELIHSRIGKKKGRIR